MTARPMLFSAPMVRALLAGMKTQTRRVLKLKKAPANYEITPELVYYLRSPTNNDKRLGAVLSYNGKRTTFVEPIPIAVDDLLWVRETWSHTGQGVWTVGDAQRARGLGSGHVIFRASDDDGTQGWFPSIYMPRWASRLTLRVTAVKVERLQDISETDAMAEGAIRNQWHLRTHAQAFRKLWNTINESEAWDANPWVVAYTFEVIKANVDNVMSEDVPA